MQYSHSTRETEAIDARTDKSEPRYDSGRMPANYPAGPHLTDPGPPTLPGNDKRLDKRWGANTSKGPHSHPLYQTGAPVNESRYPGVRPGRGPDRE